MFLRAAKAASVNVNIYLLNLYLLDNRKCNFTWFNIRLYTYITTVMFGCWPKYSLIGFFIHYKNIYKLIF